MKTAYLGDGHKRQAFPVKTLLAALAMMFVPAVAMAQPPAEAPPALPMEEPAAPPAAEAPAAAPAEAAPLKKALMVVALPTPSRSPLCGKRATSSPKAR
jgi:hypothetical protein